MKLTEICDLAATVCVRESDAICCRAHKKVTDIEAVTVDGKFIAESYKLGINDAMSSFVKKYFHCDEYFFTGRKSSVVCKTSLYGAVTKLTVSADLHTVIKL